jgi:hypothetical protein
MEESISKKLSAIRAMLLDKSTTPGEKRNAKNLLEKLLEKYNLSEDDLLSDVKNVYRFQISNEFEHSLLIQIIGKVTGETQVSYWRKNPYQRGGRNSNKTIWTDLSLREFTEITELYEVYKKALKKELSLMVTAFIQSNNIFSSNNSETDRKLTREEIEEMLKIIQLSMGIQPVKFAQKERLLSESCPVR